MIVWPGIEGYNYPFQTPYADSWAWFIDGLAQVAGTLTGAARSSGSSTRTRSRR